MHDSLNELNAIDDDQSNTVFRDVTLLALSGFVAIVLLLLPWLNLKTKQELIKESFIKQKFVAIINLLVK